MVAARIATPTLAEDITQEVFLRLWRQPDRYDPDRGTLRAFLMAVTHNVAVDRLRADNARRDREQRAVRLQVWESTEQLEGTTVLDAQRSAIDAALASLTPAEREAIIVAYYGNCSYREAATTLGLSEGTVKSRIRRGLFRLHAALPGPRQPTTCSSASSLAHGDRIKPATR